MNTYQVGDTVKIRKDLEVGKTYNNDLFVRNMSKYLGKTVKITKISKNLSNNYFYYIDNNDYSWSSKMFEPVTRNLSCLKQGDIIGNKEDKRKILGVCGEVIFPSRCDDFERADSFYTPQELEELDYKLLSPQEETITVLGKTYLKSDVEKTLEDIKSFK